MKWALSELQKDYSGLWHRVRDRAVRPETDIIMQYLTFSYIYFPNLFCQNAVKKNCKSVPLVFFKTTYIKYENKYRKHLPEET